MAAAAREHFTVDLRGLRCALATRAARDAVTESDVLRGALATALGTSRDVDPGGPNSAAAGRPGACHVKLSVRLVQPAARRLDLDARAAGLSRGAYLARLVRGASPIASSADRVAMCAALNKSSEELAVMSRDINHLTSLLRQGEIEAARSYTARHERLDRDVRAHLALAGAVLVDLSRMR
jgi:hypothetical protein